MKRGAAYLGAAGVLLTAVALTLPSSAFAITNEYEAGFYGCGGPAFHESVFDGPAGAKRGDTRWARKLKRIVRDPERYSRPRWEIHLDGIRTRGWRLLARDGNWVSLGSGLPSRRLQALLLKRGPRGKWRVYDFDRQCRPTARRDGAATAEWTLDPDEPAPSPGSTSLRIHVYERACASGQDAEGRVLPPRIEYLARRIVITYWLEPRDDGAQTCPDNPPTPVTLELEEPLGERALMDGLRLPPDRRYPDGVAVY